MTSDEARELLPGSGDIKDQIESLGGTISEQGAAEFLSWLVYEWVSTEGDNDEDDLDDDDEEMDGEDFDEVLDDDEPDDDESKVDPRA